jgi:hypothetical protein
MVIAVNTIIIANPTLNIPLPGCALDAGLISCHFKSTHPAAHTSALT